MASNSNIALSHHLLRYTDYVGLAPTDTISPYANAVILISTIYHASQAFYSYTRFGYTSAGGYFFGALGSILLAAFGLWCLMFGSDKGHISKRTGADKRTSGFPFRNTQASKRKGKDL